MVGVEESPEGVDPPKRFFGRVAALLEDLQGDYRLGVVEDGEHFRLSVALGIFEKFFQLLDLVFEKPVARTIDLKRSINVAAIRQIAGVVFDGVKGDRVIGVDLLQPGVDSAN